jgi:hypothetical protein
MDKRVSIKFDLVHVQIESVSKELHGQIESVSKELHGQVESVRNEVRGISEKVDLVKDMERLKVEVAELKRRR